MIPARWMTFVAFAVAAVASAGCQASGDPTRALGTPAPSSPGTPGTPTPSVERPAPTGSPGTSDTVFGAWLDLLIFENHILLAETVPIVFTPTDDEMIKGTRPYTLEGEPPCGTIHILIWPERVSGQAPDAARRMRRQLPAEVRDAAQFFLGESIYPDCAPPERRVPTVVAFTPTATPSTDASGPGAMYWCTPAFNGTPDCRTHMRR